MSYKPRIKILIVSRDTRSEAEIKTPHVTKAMYEAAYDLIRVMSGQRRRKRS